MDTLTQRINSLPEVPVPENHKKNEVDDPHGLVNSLGPPVYPVERLRPYAGKLRALCAEVTYGECAQLLPADPNVTNHRVFLRVWENAQVSRDRLLDGYVWWELQMKHHDYVTGARHRQLVSGNLHALRTLVHEFAEGLPGAWLRSRRMPVFAAEPDCSREIEPNSRDKKRDHAIPIPGLFLREIDPDEWGWLQSGGETLIPKEPRHVNVREVPTGYFIVTNHHPPTGLLAGVWLERIA